MKKERILLIASIAVICVGVALLIAGTVLSFMGQDLLSDIFLGISSILGIGALALLIWRLTIIPGPRPNPNYGPKPNPNVRVKVVDVKDIPKSNEEKLYEQYEDLYKRNLISKEELDQKRSELLGK